MPTKTKEPAEKPKPTAGEKGMGDRIYEHLERPQSPSEAALHHENLELRRRIDRLEKHLGMPKESRR